MVKQVDSTGQNNEFRQVKEIINTDRPEHWPKEAAAMIRLTSIFDVDGNGIIENDPKRGIDEEAGMEKVVESGGKEQYNIYREGKWVGYVLDGSKLGTKSDTYEYVTLNEKQERTYYQRLNIYTGDETLIMYPYDDKGNSLGQIRYHNRQISDGVEVEYTGPNNDLVKKMTETKAVYKQEFVLDKDGNKIYDPETEDFKVTEKLAGYYQTVIEYEYDKNFKRIGVHKSEPVFTKHNPAKRLNIKG